MREVEVTTTYQIYKFEELNAEAKEKVKEWYLEGQIPEIFEEDIQSQVSMMFPNSELKIQFSLNYCQGDGVNIYGTISIQDLLEFKDKFKKEDINYPSLEMLFTDKELKALKFYADIISADTIKLPENLRYSYCMVNRAEIAETISEALYDIRMIRYDVLCKFEQFTQDIISNLCREIENEGYDYFYEISEDELKVYCESEDFDFLEDGTVFEIMKKL